jgi:hypothetical protein
MLGGRICLQNHEADVSMHVASGLFKTITISRHIDSADTEMLGCGHEILVQLFGAQDRATHRQSKQPSDTIFVGIVSVPLTVFEAPRVALVRALQINHNFPDE